MSVCGVCLKSISRNQLKLTCVDCNKDFHGGCYKMSKADVESITAEGSVWRCQPCGDERRKSLKLESKSQEGKLTLADLMDKITDISNNQKQQEMNYNKTFESFSEKMEENTKAMMEQKTSVEHFLKVIEDLTAENKRLNKKVIDLEVRLEGMEQYSRANAVEIHGVPMQKNEDVVSVVREVGKALDINISDSMIDACHRLGRSSDSTGRPPAIIVKFVRRLDKEELLRRRRVKSTLSTRHMNLQMDQPVYINEALSPARRQLYRAARQVKLEKRYKYLWLRAGKIFLRKEEGQKVIQVTCQADLDKL